MDTGGIGVSNLPNQRYQAPFRKKVDYNIMVVGANGLGKTTFLNMLLDTNKVPLNGFTSEKNTLGSNYVLNNGDLTPKQFYDKNPRWYKESIVNFQKYNINVVEKNFSINLALIEVDNLGSSVCNNRCWAPVEEYIKKQFAIYQENEVNAIKLRIKDTRIHACLFFIDPNPSGLRCIDMYVMKRISKLCNLIPVIAKSDLLSPSIVQQLYEKIQKDMEDNEIRFFGSSPSNIIEECGKPPYFLISFSKNNNEEYTREYTWGSIQLDNSAVNDYLKIKDLLVRKGFCELKESTEQIYIKFRTNQLIEKHNLDTEFLNKPEKEELGVKTKDF